MKCPQCGQPLANPNQPCPQCRTLAVPPMPAGLPGGGGSRVQRTSLSGDLLDDDPSYAGNQPTVYAMPLSGQTVQGAPPLHTLPASPLPPAQTMMVTPLPYAPGTMPHAATQRQRTWGFVAFLMALFVIGGGFAFYRSHHKSTIYPLATRTRRLQEGDTFTYRIKTLLALQGLLQEGRGRERETVHSRLLDGHSVFEVLHQRSLSRSDLGDLQKREFLVQDPKTNALWLVAEQDDIEDPVRKVAQPWLYTPGEWANNFQAQTEAVFDTGETRQRSWNVEGAEAVDTPLGKFYAWRVTHDVTNSGGASMLFSTSTHMTAWYAPQLDFVVKRKDVITLTGDLKMTLEYVLESTNVPLDAAQSAPSPVTATGK